MMDKKILAELGDYLLAHREEITGEWVRAVEQDPDILSTDHLKVLHCFDRVDRPFLINQMKR